MRFPAALRVSVPFDFTAGLIEYSPAGTNRGKLGSPAQQSGLAFNRYESSHALPRPECANDSVTTASLHPPEVIVVASR